MNSLFKKKKKIIQNYLANKLKSHLVTAVGNCCCSSWGSLGVTLRGKKPVQPRRGGYSLCVPSWNRASSEIPYCSRGSCSKVQGRHQ